MLREKKIGMPLNLQFFAESNDNESNTGNNQNDNLNNNQGDNLDNNENNGNDNNSDNRNNLKKFTQEQVNIMMAKEKREGKKSVLKSLGFSSEEDAKKAFSLLKALTDSQKTEDEKLKEQNSKLSEDKQDAEDRAMLAEAKLSCIIAGVDKDSVDDVITIALSKITDDENLDKVLEKMKKESRYSSFFVKQSNENGTGGIPGHSNGKKTSVGEYGKRLAEARKRQENSSGNKSNFFNIG